MCLTQQEAAYLPLQLKWTDSLVDLLFLHTAMGSANSTTQSITSFQLTSIIEKIRE